MLDYDRRARARDSSRRLAGTVQARRAFLDDLKATIPVYAVTTETAELVGKLSAESSRKGVVIPFDDLLIGASALERGYAVVTRNPHHFQRIEGLRVIRF